MWSKAATDMRVGASVGDAASFRIRFVRGEPDNLARGQNTHAYWRDFVRLFSAPLRSNVRHADYLSFAQDAKLREKAAAGWYLGAVVRGGWRALRNVRHHTLITLDLDEHTSDVLERLRSPDGHPLASCYYLVHSTRSHTQEAPKLRVVIPLAEPVIPDDYGPLSRLAASLVDPTMRSIDPVSHRPAQMMFFPTLSADQPYVFHENVPRRPTALSPEHLRRAWGTTWDYDALPRNPDREQHLRTPSREVENPLQKRGPVGDFCRMVGTIQEAIKRYLSDFYAPSDAPDRYTWLKGSGANGIVIYDDLWLYSHHSTDPCAGRLCNAFDAVRLCLFGHRDAPSDASLPPQEQPSWKAMLRWLEALPEMQSYRARQIDALISGALPDRDDCDSVDGDVLHTHGNACTVSVRSDASAGTVHPQSTGSFFDVFSLPSDEQRERLFGPLLPTDTLRQFGALPAPPRQPRQLDRSCQSWDWLRELQRNKQGRIIPTDANLWLILKNDMRLGAGHAVIREQQSGNLFLIRSIYRASGALEMPAPRALNEEGSFESLALTVVLLLSTPEEQGGYGVQIGVDRVRQLLVKAADRLPSVDAFRLWFEDAVQLSHVGAFELPPMQRLLDWFPDYLRIPEPSALDGGHEEYQAHQVFGSLFLQAYAARLAGYAVKFDYMPVLIGSQGGGKSSFARILSLQRHLSHLVHMSPHQPLVPDHITNPRMEAELTSTATIVEEEEIAVSRRADMERLKAFLSRSAVTARAAYARQTETRARRFMVIGTTNEAKFLRDATGNRRFWPVEVGLSRDRLLDFDRFEREILPLLVLAYREWAASGRPTSLSMPPQLAEVQDRLCARHMMDSPEKLLARRVDDMMLTALPPETALRVTPGTEDWEQLARDVREVLDEARGLVPEAVHHQTPDLSQMLFRRAWMPVLEIVGDGLSADISQSKADRLSRAYAHMRVATVDAACFRRFTGDSRNTLPEDEVGMPLLLARRAADLPPVHRAFARRRGWYVAGIPYVVDGIVHYS